MGIGALYVFLQVVKRFDILKALCNFPIIIISISQLECDVTRLGAMVHYQHMHAHTHANSCQDALYIQLTT